MWEHPSFLDFVADTFPLFDTKRRLKDHEMAAVRLLARAILATGRFPTLGEVLTWIGRHEARLENLEERIAASALDISHRCTYECLHAFWTKERLARLEPEHAHALQEWLDRPLERYRGAGWPTGVINEALRAAKDGALVVAWQETCFPIRERADTEKEAAHTALIRTAGLDERDLKRIDSGGTTISKADYDRFRGDDAGGFHPFIRMIRDNPPTVDGKSFGRPTVSEPSSRDAFYCSGTLDQARRTLCKHPQAIIETTLERDLRLNQLPRLRQLTAETATERILLAPNLLQLLTDDNPLIREAVLRFLEELGFDPRSDAAFVTSGRQVGWAGDTYDGSWHLYPIPASGYVVTVGVHEHSLTLIRIDTGDLETVKARLARESSPTYVRDRSIEDSERLTRELDPAPHLAANVFAAYPNLFDTRKIAAQYALRAAVEAERQRP